MRKWDPPFHISSFPVFYEPKKTRVYQFSTFDGIYLRARAGGEAILWPVCLSVCCGKREAQDCLGSSTVLISIYDHYFLSKVFIAQSMFYFSSLRALLPPIPTFI